MTNLSLNLNKVKCPNCITSTVIHKFNSDKFQIYFCKKCLSGFTYPVPKNLDKYYSDNYWQYGGMLGKFKDLIYSFFQLRRRAWVLKYIQKGEILDVGSGEGIFSTLMEKKINVTSLDAPSSKIKNPKVIKKDFLKWKTNQKFDAIVFWESLEHIQYPQKYLKKAFTLLKRNGYIFIEYPRFDGLESRLFRNYWFHLDPPRHLSHFTPKGLNNLLLRERLTPEAQSGVFAFEYVIAGFIQSILNIFSGKHNNFFRNSRNILLIFFLVPAIFASIIVEIIFFIIGQSPIYLTIAKKV